MKRFLPVLKVLVLVVAIAAVCFAADANQRWLTGYRPIGISPINYWNSSPPSGH